MTRPAMVFIASVLCFSLCFATAAVLAAEGASGKGSGAAMTRGLATIVASTEATLKANLASGTTIQFGANIALTSEVVLDGQTGLVIDGMSAYSLNARGSIGTQRRCLRILGGASTSVTVQNLVITGGLADDGGGFSMTSGTAAFIACSISSNIADNTFGYYSYGGAVNILGGTVSFSACSIAGNIADYGGGMYISSATVTLVDCVVSGNTIRSSGGYAGGALYIETSVVTVTRCAFTGNAAITTGGGVHFLSGALYLTGCSFTSNTAGGGGRDIYVITTSSPIFQMASSCGPGSYNAGAGTLDCVGCGSAFPADLSSSCSGCGVGKYSATSGRITACTATCAAGLYSGVGASSCTLCSAGRYEPSPSQASCTLLCPEGQYSSSGATSCTSCDAGRYSNQQGQGSCPLFCPAGTYSSSGATACTLCSAGRLQASTGATGCPSQCGAGTYSQVGASSCIACGAGSYSQTEASSCTDCGAGHYQAASGQGSCPSLCSAGKFSNTGASACSDCKAGRYQALSGQSTCPFLCSSGKYSLPGAVFCSTCDPGLFQPFSGRGNCTDPCSTGQYSSAGASSCTPCAPGKYASELRQSSCQPCGPATYAAGTGSVTCSNCEAGRYSTDPGQVSCPLMCSAGQYSASAATSCSSCGTGKYQPAAGAADCAPCIGGQYQASTGQTSCISCGAGKFTTGDVSSCEDCASGKYSALIGRTVACTESCSAGKFSGAGAAACESCAPGTFASNASSSVCDSCTAGYFAAATASACSPCPAGRYQALSGQSTCPNVCNAGTFATSGSTGCTSCFVGKFTNLTAASACASCPAGYFQPSLASTSCIPCYAGFYCSSTGLSSQSGKCPAGKYSTAGASTCSFCPGGSYSAAAASGACASCVAGSYAATGATRCVSCTAGRYQALQASTSCALCGIDQYSLPGASACISCPVGEHSTAGSGSCSEQSQNPTTSPAPTPPPTPVPSAGCSIGEFLDVASGTCLPCPEGTMNERSLPPFICSPCAAGLFQPHTGASTCLLCAVGTFSSPDKRFCVSCQPGEFVIQNRSLCLSCPQRMFAPVPLNDRCDSCPAGSVTNRATGATACTACPSGYSSSATGDDCAVAAPSYFLDPRDTTKSLACPHHARCSGGATMPRPDPGFWIDRLNVDYVAAVYKCPWERACSGAAVPLTAAGVGEGGSTDECWSLDAYLAKSTDPYFAQCDSDDLLCESGSEGPLCSKCSSGFTLSVEDQRCVLCEDGAVLTMSALGAGLGLAALVVATVYFSSPDSLIKALHQWLLKAASKVSPGSFRVMWVTFQIVQSVSWSLGDVSWPSNYNRFSGLLSIVTLDFVSFECVLSASVLESVLFWSLWPGGVAALICAVNFARSRRAGPSPEKRERIFQQQTYLLLVLTFMVLPPVSRRLCQVLDCIELAGRKYMRADTTVECVGPHYQHLVAVDVAFLAVYLSLPLVWLALLFSKRDLLYPSEAREGRTGNKAAALTAVEVEASVGPLRFLFSAYRPSCFYFEVFEAYRRVTFVGLLPLVSSKPNRRAAFGLFLSLVSAVGYREVEPFRRSETNLLAHVAQFVIMVVYGAALTLSTDLSKNVDRFSMGAILLAVNFLLVGFVLCLGANRYYTEERRGLVLGRRVLSPAELQLVNDVMKGDAVFSSTVAHKRAVRSLGQYLLDPSQVSMIRRIGAGAVGEVYQATYNLEPVAVKTLLRVTEATLRDFREEILLTANLRHPNIVGFVGACWSDGLTGLVLEWAPRGSLGFVLKDPAMTEHLSWGDPLLKLATDVASGVLYLHQREYTDEATGQTKSCIMHRDLKPDNILVTDTFGAKLSDFGASRAKEREELTMTVAGTPLFTAPEVMRGEKYYESVDVYSFGMVLLQMAVAEDPVHFIRAEWATAVRDAGKDDRGEVTTRTILNSMWGGQWHPVASNSGASLSSAPSTLRALAARCCAHVPADRPSFRVIRDELRGPVAEEVERSERSFARRLGALRPADDDVPNKIMVQQHCEGPGSSIRASEVEMAPMREFREQGAVEPEAKAAPSTDSQAHIQELLDGSGREYFHNTRTGETGWDRGSVSGPPPSVVHEAAGAGKQLLAQLDVAVRRRSTEQLVHTAAPFRSASVTNALLSQRLRASSSAASFTSPAAQQDEKASDFGVVDNTGSFVNL